MSGTTPVRELAYAALAAALSAAITDVPVERNRRDECDFAAGEAPLLVLRDGDQQANDGLAAGLTSYRMEAQVEGSVTATTDALLGLAASTLYARVARALFGAAIPLAGTPFELWPVEGALSVEMAPTASADGPAATFFLDLTFTLDVPTGAPFA